jgi:glucose-1-phosphate thymidylyltransferase
MRPHTLTVPKPLIPIAGKPIVQRLVEDIAKVCNQPVEQVAFVIGDFGKEVENQLLDIAKSVGAKGSIIIRISLWVQLMLFYVLKKHWKEM